MVDLYRGLQEKQLAVLHRYVQEVAEKMSPRRAMRFLQIEAQLDALEALQIGKQVPLIELSFTAPAASMPGRVPHRQAHRFAQRAERSRRHSVVRLIPSRRAASSRLPWQLSSVSCM
ncbi:hypothetical protein P4056_09160 [Pseudomonas aeruginosa]|nr:hypothetical protein [Pseudomonas aeruginosa]